MNGQRDGENGAGLPLFVSYYTDAYTGRAADLVKSLDALRLPHHVEKRPDSSSAFPKLRWLNNVRAKPDFILSKMREQGSGRTVVWVDADCVARREPTLLLQGGFDVAAFRWRPPWWNNGYEVPSGTVGFGSTPKAVEILKAWRDFIARHPDTPTQPRLEQAINAVSGAIVRWLPVDYYYIHDTHAELYPDVRPVFEHFQHSRVTKGTT